jgi:DNA-binding LacI/PurR family transcriptional regulator
LDLVEIVKKATAKNLKLGKTIGVITYNDSPFKEILAGGISVLSTDFQRMGAEVADMILTCARRKVKNPFSLILRSSV